MEPIWMFPLFLCRVFAIALVIVGLTYSFHGAPYLGSYVVEFIVASVVSFWLLLLDTIIIYPRLRSPLRNLPLVPVSLLHHQSR